jgi:hypothetical protein
MTEAMSLTRHQTARLLAIIALAALAALALAGTTSAREPKSPARYQRTIVSANATQSYNWSGYNQGALEKGHAFHQVAATWTVPRATQHREGEAEYSATWTGIGGGCVDASCTVTDSTLIQAGTEQDVDASGKASYSAWWELIPAPSVTISSLNISPGDVVTVTIGEVVAGSEVWQINVLDRTSGQSFSMTTPYSSTYATAEWIEETPIVISSDGTITVGPMPNLHKVNFDLGQANAGNPNLARSEELQLVDFNLNVLATPSSPDPDTDGFNDCTYATRCAAPRSS